jgi:hypothetical protein
MVGTGADGTPEIQPEHEPTGNAAIGSAKPHTKALTHAGLSLAVARMSEQVGDLERRVSVLEAIVERVRPMLEKHLDDNGEPKGLLDRLFG